MNRYDTEDEAADVSEERDPAAGVRLNQRKPALPELDGKPDADEQDGGELLEEDEEEEDRRQHARIREQNDVRAQDSRDRPARADVRDAGVRSGAGRQGHDGMRGSSRQARGEID